MSDRDSESAGAAGGDPLVAGRQRIPDRLCARDAAQFTPLACHGAVHRQRERQRHLASQSASVKGSEAVSRAVHARFGVDTGRGIAPDRRSQVSERCTGTRTKRCAAGIAPSPRVTGRPSPSPSLLVLSIHVKRTPSFLVETCLAASLATARLRCPLLAGLIIRERSPRDREWGRRGWCTLSADALSRCGPAGRGCWRGRGASASRPSGRPCAASPWRGAPRTSA